MSLSQTVLQALQILLDELFLRLGVSDVSCNWNRDGYLISRSILPVLWIRKFHFTLCKLIFALKYFVAHWLHNVICKCLCICAFTLLYQMMKFSGSWCKVTIVRSVITELVKCGIQISHEKIQQIIMLLDVTIRVLALALLPKLKTMILCVFWSAW